MSKKEELRLEQLDIEEEPTEPKTLLVLPSPTLEKWRFFLMLCACIQLLGFPTAAGGIVQYVCGFAPIAFFMLSGYLVLGKKEGRSARILRTVKRTAIVFAALCIAYAGITFFLAGAGRSALFSALLSKRLWFEFLVLNIWPFAIGNAIWYVQALLYAYIILFFLDKWKLLRYDLILFALLFLFTVFTGELNGLTHFGFLGYMVFPANFLNRALPYLLLGGIFARFEERLMRIPAYVLLIGAVIGVGLTVAEPLFLYRIGILGYDGHVLGMALTAAALSLLVFRRAFKKSKVDFSQIEIFPLPRLAINMIYYFCQPAALFLGLLIAGYQTGLFAKVQGYLGLVTFLICLIPAVITAWIANRFFERAVPENKEDPDE